MSDSGNFAELAREFQGIEAPSEALVSAVEKGRRKLVRGKILGVALSVFICAFAVFVVWRDHDAASLVFAGMQIGVVVAVMTFVSYSSRHAWRARTETTRGFLELEVERRRDWVRRMRFLRGLTPVLGIAVVIHHALMLQKLPTLPSTLSGFVGLVAPYLILAWVFWRAGQRKARFQREEHELTGQIAELERPA